MAPCADPILWPSVSVASVSRLAVIMCWTPPKKLDKCGVCGGKGDSCRKVSGSFSPSRWVSQGVLSLAAGVDWALEIDSGGPCTPGSTSQPLHELVSSLSQSGCEGSGGGRAHGAV